MGCDDPHLLRARIIALERENRLLKEAVSQGGHIRSQSNRVLDSTLETLKLQNVRFEAALDNMTQGLCLLDPTHRVAVLNRRFAAMFGIADRSRLTNAQPRELLEAALKAGTLAAATAEELFTFPDAAAPDAAAPDAVSGGTASFTRELVDGRLVTANRQPVAGGGWVVTYEDVTAKRHAEQQVAFAKAESRAKSGFLAMMSHEIRTPMNGVLGLAATLFDTELTDLQSATVAAIQDSGNALLRILNDILDFSKLEAGQMQLEDVPFSPAALTQDPVSLLGPRAAAKGLRIDISCDDGLPAALLGDAGRLRQVLLNLVSNAIKFTECGSVAIRLTCPERDVHAATIVWTITDTGVGIPPDRIDGLFGEFFQADASITRRFGGSGLGLAISRRLVEQMGGRIAVRSQPGEGSSFEVTLRLPITKPAREHAPAPLDTIAVFEARLRLLGRPARVLLAEDNPTNQFVVLQLLRGFDLRVDVASNGLEAVHAASCACYDVICMDMSMPEMDGLAATRAIRAMGGQLATVPIVALTANAFPEDAAACLGSGMTGFLAKPVSKKSLVGALLAAFDQPARVGKSASGSPNGAN
jgi:signal transduction histidine kinase/CheY-like chemotaxis protein